MAMLRTAVTGSMLLLLSGLSGCMSSPPAPSAGTPSGCTAGELLTQSTLYFGLNRPKGPPVTTAEWQQFVDSEITPRFRDGLTIFSASGQWLGNDGKLAREPSKAVMLIHASDAESSHKIEALRRLYQARFDQESVMRVDHKACVDF